MFATTHIPETMVDYGSLGFDGIIGVGGDIVLLLLCVFIVALSMMMIEPHSRPPV